MVITATLPLYRDVAAALEQQIETMGPNSILPSEQDLARRFGVSRVTVRLALGLLERGGLVSRQRGRGTIVSPAKVVRRLVPVRTIEQDLREQGIKLETRVLGYQRAAPAPPHVRALLRLPRSGSVGFLALARMVEGRIICDDRRYLAPFVKDRFEPEMVHSQPVSTILRELTGLTITALDWETEITRATPETGAVLGITPGLLVVSNTSIEYLSDGRPVEISVMSYRVDRVKFKFSVSGDTPTYETGVEGSARVGRGTASPRPAATARAVRRRRPGTSEARRAATTAKSAARRHS
jgi:GntR family transcriptional regulator